MNFMGFNNAGANLWAEQLRYEQETLGINHIPMIANIANAPDTPFEGRAEEIRGIVRLLAPYVQAIEYNGSCPNV